MEKIFERISSPYMLRAYGGKGGLVMPSKYIGSYGDRFTLLMLVAATELNLAHKI